MKSDRSLHRYVNKQRTLIFSTRGITHRDRHLIQDLRDLMPHSKKDNKLDVKGMLSVATWTNLRVWTFVSSCSAGKLAVVTEVCDMKNCNNCIFLEARKKKDLYMWMSKAPEVCVLEPRTLGRTLWCMQQGPSIKFLVQNVHTMSEVKMTGNCLKGAHAVGLRSGGLVGRRHALFSSQVPAPS
jgi:ribosome biogenesis protein BRX1